jgi:hypothetical protein
LQWLPWRRQPAFGGVIETSDDLWRIIAFGLLEAGMEVTSYLPAELDRS